MSPVYAHCPYCGFPVVVHAVERAFPRRCRQCREEYLPGAPLRRDVMSAAARNENVVRGRIALRSRVRQRRQSLK